MPYAVFVLLILLPTVAMAQKDSRAAFYGTWGTPAQCTREPVKPGGTVLSQPFEISSGWLKQGDFWCGLNWGPIARRSNGLFAGAHAQCGEDAQRSYFIGLELSDSNLRIRWDFPFSNGPLARC